ncbi:hypothetical protein CHGG_04004 [Chaetomium globosum CBS 148.51]|uniref:SUN domain-containing protein n=1 Tax=Chaetomium globosum (strain ATCC 6205 / CBS 148.51 / DSM 1962 / NBRC 6347 / NRRL 1970) TaxID=306901 RepID=Q2H2J2_CHAGB|nr:uncharacterized protein CHGG_04004 [Chaetomium globosum CBS 148.51]EAQ87385.1 hypothetical protein CHGG_04004 [Chaetomium globosum CBS 148.51]
MANVTSAQLSPAKSQRLATASQESVGIINAMPPRRRLRATASPSPGPQGSRASTPARDPVTGRVISDLGGKTRTPVPAKYSTSYGSPIAQLPDRSSIGGGGNITKAAAEIFTKVKRDNVAAEVRRRAKDQARAARAGSIDATAPPPSPPTIRPTIEMDGLEFEAESVEEQSNGEEGSEYEDLDEPQTKRRRAPRKPAPKDSRKRARDDEEAEARSEKERKERDARLRLERSAEAGEARSRRSQKLAEEKAERERKAEEERKVEEQRKAEQERKAEQQRKAAQRKAEQQRKAEEQQKTEEQQKAERELAEQVAREQAARAAMPPPPQPFVPRPAPGVALTPNNLAMPTDLNGDRPGSARIFVEESNLFHDANLQTPTPPPLRDMRRAGPAAPPSPPQPVQPLEEEVQLPTSPPAEHPSPPSVLKRPPRRPGGTTPAATRSDRPSGINPYRHAIPQTPPASGSPELEDEEQEESSQETLADPYATISFENQLRNRLKPQEGKGKLDGGEEQVEQAEDVAAASSYDYRPRWVDVKESFTLRSVMKVVAGAFILLHLIRLTHSFVRPDLFEAPVLTLNWYGWNDWANNVGQFFPSPLLHPLGVLTDDQYDDLKEYLERRTSRTETVVDNLKSVLPKVVSVKRDNKGKIIIADEFWAALKALIQHDNSILSLDGKSQISQQHWKAIEQRLKEAGLLDKPLSADDVARIVDKSAPVSWEKWLEKNKQKVADTIGQGKGSSKGPSKGADEGIVSKEEFMRELTARLAKSKTEVDIEMGGLRKELDGVLHEVKKLASDAGMTKTETITLINKVVDKEIVRRLAQIGSRPGAAKIDAMFSNRVNFFSPGNNAKVDISLSSPTYQLDTPRIASQKWLKSMRGQPQFLQDKSQALRPWSDPGHCWCAATLGNKNRTHPATLAVQLPRFVIPQQVLLEHIDPAATTDPLAMPRDVEVWARIEDPDHQDRVLDWMAVQFPADLGPPANNKLIDDGFAKIGHFSYEHRQQDEGIYVHQLSRDLVERLRAATDLIVLRAVSNYGAKDHTCFYRVRLYGDEVEELETE